MSTDAGLERKYAALLRSQHLTTLRRALPVLVALAEHQNREVGFLTAAITGKATGAQREMLQVEEQRAKRYAGLVTRIRKYLVRRSWNAPTY